MWITEGGRNEGKREAWIPDLYTVTWVEGKPVVRPTCPMDMKG
jgi:hypothetical protein